MAVSADVPQRHVVVFDCNIYLDVARVIGAPFTWESFYEVVAKYSAAPLGRPFSYFDSLRAIALATSGRFVGAEPLEVWTNNHIDSVVHYKATQSATPDPDTRTEDRGLGWSPEHADTLYTLIDKLIDDSGGGSLGDTVPDSHPPLDHEDGMVYGACKHLAGNDPFALIWCVTNDHGFIEDRRAGRLTGHSKVLSANQFVQLVRKARSPINAMHGAAQAAGDH